MTDEPRRKVLILHIEVPGVYADDLEESAAIWAVTDKPTAQDRLSVVLEEWVRPEVGLTIVTLPGEKNMNDDFMVVAHNGHIVGAEVRDL